jgi:FkbM family methyltransferase
MSLPQRIKGIVGGRSAVLKAVWQHPLNRGSRTRAVGDYFLWNVVKFTMQARHVLPLAGNLEIILGRKENYGSAVYAHGISDFSEMMFLAHLLRAEDMFLDVGANVGMYSVWVAGVTGAKSIAFEPVPETHETLIKNVRLNSLDDLITTHRVAAGDAPGSVQMTASQGGLDHIVTGDAESGATVRVEVATVDSFCADIAPIAAKIDVEGFEMHALRGMAEVLGKPSLKAIVIELQDWTLRHFGTSEEEVRAYLRSFGFSPYAYDPDMRTLTSTEHKPSLNEIFVRDADIVIERLRAAPKVKIPGRLQGV